MEVADIMSWMTAKVLVDKGSTTTCTNIDVYHSR